MSLLLGTYTVLWSTSSASALGSGSSNSNADMCCIYVLLSSAFLLLKHTLHSPNPLTRFFASSWAFADIYLVEMHTFDPVSILLPSQHTLIAPCVPSAQLWDVCGKKICKILTPTLPSTFSTEWETSDANQAIHPSVLNSSPMLSRPYLPWPCPPLSPHLPTLHAWFTGRLSFPFPTMCWAVPSQGLCTCCFPPPGRLSLKSLQFRWHMSLPDHGI